MRVLITGSRDWQHAGTIAGAFDYYVSSRYGDFEIILVSGACPTGADKMCEEEAARRGWKVERHPADWKRHGKKAGFMRNREMVDLGADICLAFCRNNSAGTMMTYNLAQHALIPAHLYRDDKDTTPPEEQGEWDTSWRDNGE